MIDPQPVHVAADQQLEHQAVTFREDLGVLHANGRQFVDVEETPIIDLVGGGLPVREPIDLGVEQLVEVVVTVRVVGRAVELLHVAADELGDGRASAPSSVRSRPLITSFSRCRSATPVGLGFRAFGQVLQRGDDALQFAQVLGVGRQGFLQRVQPVRQDGPVGPRVEGQKRSGSIA